MSILNRLRVKRKDPVAAAAADYIERLEHSVISLIYAIEAENPLPWQDIINQSKDVLENGKQL